MSDALDQPLAFLGGLSANQFLREYWQKKPLLVRAGCREAVDLISPDELAGLALESEVESRLILEYPAHDPEQQWQLRPGPFDEDDFNALPESHWTLLVQAVDHYIPEVRKLLEKVNFIPNWRVDDIMVSYATDQGGVGPHFDYYDVFLIQAAGEREWRIGQPCDDSTPLIPELPLKILHHFQQQESWCLQPGDLLYVPPGLAHWGIAQGESLTYSIGFRAPAIGDLLAEYAHEIAESFAGQCRYNDPDLCATTAPGRLDNAAIDRGHALLLTALQDKGQFADWFASQLSSCKYEAALQPPDSPITAQDLTDAVHAGANLWLDEASRCLYRVDSNDQLRCFVNGTDFPTPPAAALGVFKQIADQRYLSNTQLTEALNAGCLEWLLALLNSGLVFLDDSD